MNSVHYISTILKLLRILDCAQFAECYEIYVTRYIYMYIYTLVTCYIGGTGTVPQGRVACPLKKVTEYIMYGGVGWDVCNEGGERARESERDIYIHYIYGTLALCRMATQIHASWARRSEG